MGEFNVSKGVFEEPIHNQRNGLKTLSIVFGIVCKVKNEQKFPQLFEKISFCFDHRQSKVWTGNAG